MDIEIRTDRAPSVRQIARLLAALVVMRDGLALATLADQGDAVEFLTTTIVAGRRVPLGYLASIGEKAMQDGAWAQRSAPASDLSTPALFGGVLFAGLHDDDFQLEYLSIGSVKIGIKDDLQWILERLKNLLGLSVRLDDVPVREAFMREVNDATDARSRRPLALAGAGLILVGGEQLQQTLAELRATDVIARDGRR